MLFDWLYHHTQEQLQLLCISFPWGKTKQRNPHPRWCKSTQLVSKHGSTFSLSSLADCQCPALLYIFNQKQDPVRWERDQTSNRKPREPLSTEGTREVASVPREWETVQALHGFAKLFHIYIPCFSLPWNSLHISRFHIFPHSKAGCISRCGFWRKMGNIVLFEDWVLGDLTTWSSAELCSSGHWLAITWSSHLVILYFVPLHTNTCTLFVESALKQSMPMGSNNRRNFIPVKPAKQRCAPKVQWELDARPWGADSSSITVVWQDWTWPLKWSQPKP